jgi:hypothetical protein
MTDRVSFLIESPLYSFHSLLQKGQSVAVISRALFLQSYGGADIGSLSPLIPSYIAHIDETQLEASAVLCCVSYISNVGRNEQ